MARSSYIIIGAILLFGAYLYGVTALSPVEPVGRLGFVKLANPDMYPGHPQSKVLASYAAQRGSKCALVVHYAGSSNYRHYREGNVTIIELAYISSEYRTDIDWGEVIESFIFGVPDGKYRYRADGYEFDSLDEAMDYVESVARSKGQEGPMPMVFHGTVREGNVFINPGCGFPLYVQIAWRQYGRLGAYYYIVKGLLHPYLNNPYAAYELSHASDLQRLYNEGALDYTGYD
ncbi:hypothetical protein [Methanothermobacter sp. EMTCatA1]|uniref:hypothetical protein n=1 Tax=Methanothermobacter sp. EMTCatA1 TaxID=2017966 RepID=UPI000B5DF140|nr:hypothetical protein [Methanothermobacter sp. EMTCatA1]BAZ99761.1 hypothetical protein tca_01722 [Methanothermobacter sp. EMTCatA1]